MLHTRLALALAACAAFGAPAMADQGAGYLQSSAVVVRSGSGLCWRSGSWTPADAADGCDQVAQAPAAQQISDPLPPVVDAPALPQPASGFEFNVNDAVVRFDFDKAMLTAEAKKIIDELASQARNGAEASHVLVIGHADRIGSERYNHGLAMRRAQAVSERLKMNGISASVISVEESGENEPLVACKNGKGVVACLAPNRRVEILLLIQGSTC